MTVLQPLTIGDAGTAADVEGSPAMLAVPQPDTMIDAGLYGPLTVRAVSVRGAGHRYDGTPRQDDFCLGVGGPSNEYLIAVVADGVSAGPSSHVASRAAVRFATKLLANRLAQLPPGSLDWNEIVGSVAGFVLAQARSETGDQSLDAHAAAQVMATTIAFAIIPVYGDSEGERVCIVLPVGDTSVWILRASGRWESVTDIKNEGEAVSGSATAALPLLPATVLEPIYPHVRAGDALFVLTDGVGDPLGDGSGEVGQALAQVWAAPPDRYAFAAQVDFRRRSHTDDRTVVGIWPGQEPPEPVDVALSAGSDAPSLSDSLPPVVSAVPSGSTYVPAASGGDGSYETPDGVHPDVYRAEPPPPPPKSGTDADPAPKPQSAPEPGDSWSPTEWKPTPWKPS